MKCPKCAEEGERSKVYEGDQFSTCMGTSRYYDEDGVWHYHDPNWASRTYACSRGHRWYVRRRSGCPGCGHEAQHVETVFDEPSLV